jgi:formylglycine-generating enzyme required for sulfatase activity
VREGEEDALGCEFPQHGVTISQPFYMGVYEVTQEQYKQIMDSPPLPVDAGILAIRI